MSVCVDTLRASLSAKIAFLGTKEFCVQIHLRQLILAVTHHDLCLITFLNIFNLSARKDGLHIYTVDAIDAVIAYSTLPGDPYFEKISSADSDKLRNWLSSEADESKIESSEVDNPERNNDPSSAFIRATTKKCPNTACINRESHFHGHNCHHVHRGCQSCGSKFCYKCLATEQENITIRGRASSCKCGCWSNFCSPFETDEDIQNFLVLEPYPFDVRCGCQICNTCRKGAPCSMCSGNCVVCRGVLNAGPMELTSEWIAQPADRKRRRTSAILRQFQFEPEFVPQQIDDAGSIVFRSHQNEPLVHAIRFGIMSDVRQILLTGVSRDVASAALMMACDTGSTISALLLVEAGQASLEFGLNRLCRHYVWSYQQLEIARIIVDSGTTNVEECLEALSRRPFSPDTLEFQRILRFQRANILTLGIHRNIRHEADNETPENFLVRKAVIEDVQRLLLEGTHEINMDSALQSACVCGRLDLVNVLLDGGATNIWNCLWKLYAASEDTYPNCITIAQTLISRAGRDEVSRLIAQRFLCNATQFNGSIDLIIIDFCNVAECLALSNSSQSIHDHLLRGACALGRLDIATALLRCRTCMTIPDCVHILFRLDQFSDGHEGIVRILVSMKCFDSIASDKIGDFVSHMCQQFRANSFHLAFAEHLATVESYPSAEILLKLCQLEYWAKCHELYADKLIVPGKCDIKETDPDGLGFTPLHWLSRYGRASTVEKLINAGVNVAVCDNCDRTPLEVACTYNRIEVARLLFPRTIVKSPFLLLHLTCSKGFEQLARVLIMEFNVDVNIRDNLGRTPLHIACDQGNEGVVCALLELHANVRLVDNQQRTPLHAACNRRGNDAVAVVTKLLSAGADINAKTSAGRTAFHCACAAGLEGIAALLIDDPTIDMNAIDDMGRSALHWACVDMFIDEHESKRNRSNIAKKLLSQDVDINAVDNDGRTPLFLALKYNAVDQIKTLLLDSRTKVNLIDKYGFTALSFARTTPLLIHDADVIIHMLEGGDLECAT
jgi:ankyrin repeat protein